MRRVALLPDLARLAWMTAAALVMTLVLVVASPSWGRRLWPHLTPLFLLGFWVVPYLPWIADAFPLLIVFAGPFRWVIAAAAVTGVILSASRGSSLGVRPPTTRVVFAASFVVYAVLGLYVTRTLGPGGDEPHYLVITHSIVADGDLKIENNHNQRDYRPFWGGELKPDFLRRGRDHVLYSIHAPGLPALLSPAFAVAGYAGAVLTLAAMTALAMVPLFKLARAVAGVWPATMAWIATGFTVPVAGHAWTVYPEVPAAAISAWVGWWLWAPLPTRAAVWVLRGTALGLLPWLHTKFLALLIPLAACLLVRLRVNPRAATLLAAPVGISLGLWLWSFRAMYGVADPFIPYGPANKLKLVWSNVPRGLLGSLFDQEFGVLIYSPIYLLAIPGLFVMLRERATRRLALAIAGSAVLFVLAVMRVYMWWGGTSAPARFLVPVAVLAAPFMAAGFARARGPWIGVTTAGLVISVATFLLIAQPSLRLLVQNRNGAGAFVTFMQGESPLTSALPSFLEIEWWRQGLPLLVLGTACLFGVLAGWIVGQRKRGVSGAFWTGITASLTAISVLGILGSLTVPRIARSASVNRSRLALMMNYDPPRLSAFDSTRLRRLRDDDLWMLGSLEFAGGDLGKVSTVDPLLAGPVVLPAGRYQAVFWMGRRADNARVNVVYNGRPPAPLAGTLTDRANPAVVDFELPVTARGVGLAMQPSGFSDRVQRILLRPTMVVPRSRRPSASVPRAIWPIKGRPGGLVCFLDENSYPEGVLSWVKGGTTASLLVVPAGASVVRFKIRAGAAAGPVNLASPAQITRLDLAPWQDREVYVPVPAGEKFVAVSLSALNGFYPSNVDPQSGDHRYLGCQFAVELLE